MVRLHMSSFVYWRVWVNVWLLNTHHISCCNDECLNKWASCVHNTSLNVLQARHAVCRAHIYLSFTIIQVYTHACISYVKITDDLILYYTCMDGRLLAVIALPLSTPVTVLNTVALLRLLTGGHLNYSLHDTMTSAPHQSVVSSILYLCPHTSTYARHLQQVHSDTYSEHWCIPIAAIGGIAEAELHK